MKFSKTLLLGFVGAAFALASAAEAKPLHLDQLTRRDVVSGNPTEDGSFPTPYRKRDEGDDAPGCPNHICPGKGKNSGVPGHLEGHVKRAPLQVSDIDGDAVWEPTSAAADDSSELYKRSEVDEEAGTPQLSNPPRSPRLALPNMAFYGAIPDIFITSSLSISSPSNLAGFLGVCRCARGYQDTVLGANADTCTRRFIQSAAQTAKCEFNGVTSVKCIEQGGKGEMTEGDNTWWMQAFCKRCVDAGGISDPNYPCPDGYKPWGKDEDDKPAVKPVVGDGRKNGSGLDEPSHETGHGAEKDGKDGQKEEVTPVKGNGKKIRPGFTGP